MAAVWKTGKLRAGIVLIVIVLALPALLWPVMGCARRGAGPDPGQGTERPPAGSTPEEARVKITLYFGDSQAQWLVAEEREVVKKKDEPLGEIVVRELIKGPVKQGLQRTIPEGTRLLSLSVADRVATVNFSGEFQSRHWGGSAGETFTVYSVVNTLTLLEGIEKVQFLVEGVKLESLAGHIDIRGPLGPNRSLVKN